MISRLKFASLYIKAKMAVCGTAMALTFSSGSIADDIEIFTARDPAIPNVLFILDISGSMDRAVCEEDEKDNNGDCPANSPTRIQLMQDALDDVLSGVRGIGVGLMSYTTSGGQPVITLRQQIQALDTDYRGTLIDDIRDLEAGGGTPTMAALLEGQRYFSDARAEPSPITSECQSNHIVLLTDGTPGNYEPVQPTTQQPAFLDARDLIRKEKSSILTLQTAGEFQGQLSCNRVDVPGIGADRRTNNGTCGAELGEFLATHDQSTTVPGLNNVLTHTIGFAFSEDWLDTVSPASEVLADAGLTNNEGGPPDGGTHAVVQNADEIREAFAGILENLTTSFAAPTIAVDSFNESRHGNDLYYSSFQPYDTVRWDGNVKKYQLVNVEDTGDGTDTDGDGVPDVQDVDSTGGVDVDNDGIDDEFDGAVVADRNNNPIVIQGGDQDGELDPFSVSLWSDTPDGAVVLEGGFAAQLPPDPANRNWFTDDFVAGGAEPLNVIDDAPGFTAASLGLANAGDVSKVVNWALGYEDGNDGNTNHFYVAESLHGSPSLLTYSANSKAVPPTAEEVLYTGNNMGVLFALDAATGEEIWSYTPEELLPNIGKYYNDEAGDHVYGLDGSFTIHSTRKDSTVNDFEVDEAWLYMTERRGGNRIYALDISNGTNPADPFKVMWKITGGTDDFTDVAQTWSKPELVPVRIGCPDNCETKNLLLFSGGYNASVYDDVALDYNDLETTGQPASGHGNAIYLVDPETGAHVWSAGNNLVSSDNHSLNLDIEHSVVRTPVPVDTDGDGITNILYFGDIGGNVWRVDFSATEATSGGRIADLAPAGESPRFFNKVDVVRSGSSFSTSFFNIVMGSGMRSSPLFVEPAINNLYAIRDRFVFETPNRFDPVQGKRVVDYEYVVDGAGNREIITADPSILRDVSDVGSTTTVEYGFFQPMESGEKVLQPTLIHQNRVFAVTYVPPDPQGDPCVHRLGTSRLYVSSLPDGENVLPGEFGVRFYVLGDGIIDNGQIVQTAGNNPLFVIGQEVIPTEDLTAPNGQQVFRRIQRTGWIEHDGY